MNETKNFIFLCIFIFIVGGFLGGLITRTFLSTGKSDGEYIAIVDEKRREIEHLADRIKRLADDNQRLSNDMGIKRGELSESIDSFGGAIRDCQYNNFSAINALRELSEINQKIQNFYVVSFGGVVDDDIV